MSNTTWEVRRNGMCIGLALTERAALDSDATATVVSIDAGEVPPVEAVVRAGD